MKVERTWTGWDGKTRTRTDEDIVEAYLQGFQSNENRGAIENLESEVRELRRALAILLVQLHEETVVKLCSED